MVATNRRALTLSDFERMNLPREFWKSQVKHVPEAVRETVRRYLLRIDEMAEKGIGLFLTGNAGVGKTSIAALVAKEARARGYTVYFVGVWELREGLRSRAQFDDTSSILDRCREVDFLVLDGLRPEDSKEMYINERVLAELISFRKSRREVTVVTTKMLPASVRSDMPDLYEATLGGLVSLNVLGENKKAAKHKEIASKVLG